MIRLSSYGQSQVNRTFRKPAFMDMSYSVAILDRLPIDSQPDTWVGKRHCAIYIRQFRLVKFIGKRGDVPISALSIIRVPTLNGHRTAGLDGVHLVTSPDISQAVFAAIRCQVGKCEELL
jgi:hypothetical protein